LGNVVRGIESTGPRMLEIKSPGNAININDFAGKI
jgi:hypothetical protein